MNRLIYRVFAAVVAAMTIVSCYDARKRETYRLLEDVDSYIEARPELGLEMLDNALIYNNYEKDAAYYFVLASANERLGNNIEALAAINFGIHGIGASPYIGIGYSYLKAYQNSIKDRVMFEATLGITMF